MDALASKGIRSVNVVPDDEYQTSMAEGYVDWLSKQLKDK